MDQNSHSYEESRIGFFKALKTLNTFEIGLYFRNHLIKPWLFIEEEGYTGLIILI
jgi:hypothetical protein